MTNEIGVAMAGAGMVSDLHRQALAETPGLRLVGVHDIDGEVVRRRAADWAVRGYATLDDLLGDPEVDAVYVLTPAPAHVAVACRCLEAGRHVLVEKPVSGDPAEIDALVATACRSERVAMPAHNYAYMPEFRRIAALVRAGELGTVRGVWVNYVLKHPESVAAAYGGILGEVMIHHTYLALALLGPPARIHAGIHPGAWLQHDREDQAWMMWEYPGGSTASLFATFAADDQSTDPWTFMVKVIGTTGSASLSWRGVVTDSRRTPWFAFDTPIYQETYPREAEAFRDAITVGAAPVSRLEDAAMAARIVAAAYEAAGDHRVIDRNERDGTW
jgi:predicted dehydrogenase